MAKRNRFPVVYSDGREINTMEEIIENFDYDEIVKFIETEELFEWLDSRYEDAITSKIKKLDKEDIYYKTKIHEIFGLEYIEPRIEIEEVKKEKEFTKEQLERIEKLKEYTEDTDIHKYIDKVAFNQDELYDLLDMAETNIFLCGEKFNIPINKNNMVYIGINKPIIYIASKEYIDFDKRDIHIVGCEFDDKYKEVLNENNICIEESEYKKDITMSILLNSIENKNIEVEDLEKSPLTDMEEYILDGLNSISLNNITKVAENWALSIEEIFSISDTLFE